MEVFKFLFETKFNRNTKDQVPEGGYTPRDKTEAIRLLREQIHSLYLNVGHSSIEQDPLHEYGSRLWLQEIRSPRPILIPLLLTHISPMTETIKKCIQTLRPDLGEAEMAFLGASIVGQVAGHGLMLGLNQVVWGNVDQLGSQFQVSELLVDLCLNGVLGGLKVEP